MIDSFRPECHLLLESDKGWGAIACLPWDEAIFGFPVAELSLCGQSPTPVEPVSAFAAALRAFCHSTKTELISARSEGADSSIQAALVLAGFFPVDFSLLAQISRLRAENLPKSRFTLRPAERRDHDAVCRIASTAFAFGRYHGDPRFPRELANRRYLQWIRRALDGTDPDDHVLILGQTGFVTGFMHVVLRNGHADLRLGAVDPANEAGVAGFALYCEALRAIYGMGARSASAKISAANTRVLNVCAMLGFRFSNPESTFHWHAPHAAHLLPVGSVGEERLCK